VERGGREGVERIWDPPRRRPPGLDRESVLFIGINLVSSTLPCIRQPGPR